MDENSRLIIKNLPSKITEKRLRDLFSSHGTVTDCQLKFDQNGKFRKFAFLGFGSDSEATSAKDYFDKTFIDTARIQVEFCRKIGEHGISKMRQQQITNDKNSGSKNSKTLVVEIRNFAPGTKKKSLLQFFAPLKPQKIRLTKNDNSALIFLTKQSEVQAILKKNGKFFGGCKVTVSRISSDDERIRKKEEEIPDKNQEVTQSQSAADSVEQISETGRLFVRNLPYVCTVEEVETLFKKYGPLTDVKVPMVRSFGSDDDGSKKSKGIAIVTFMFPEHALKAYSELDGSIYKGRMLHIIAGKGLDDEKPKNNGDKSSADSSFKNQKATKLKASASHSHNWNALFLNPNATADIISEQLGTEKSKLLDAEQKGSSLGVRMALGESHIVRETREFLLQHGVRLDSFSEPDAPRSKRIILVKNLPAKTTADELRERFQKFGDIARLVLPPSGVSALVEFLDEQQAKKAFSTLAYSRFKTVPLYLEWAPGDVFMEPTTASEETKESLDKDKESLGKDRESSDAKGPQNEPTVQPDDYDATLFVKNLNFETTDEALGQHFSKIGPLVYATVAKKHASTNAGLLSMGFGFVRFVKSADAKRALKQLQGSDLEGFALQLKLSDRQLESDSSRSKRRRSTPPGDSTKAKAVKHSDSKILVRNIPFQATEKELETLFKTFGDLRFVRIPKKSSGDGHRGFGFVDFISESDARKAFDALCHSTHLYGRRLVMEWASTSDDTLEELQKKVAAQVFNISGRRKITKKNKIVQETEET